MVMLHPLQSPLVEGTAWLDPFVQDFRTRFLTLLAGAFRGFAPALALSVLDPQLTFSEAQAEGGVKEGVTITKADGSPLSAYDLKRLQVLLCSTSVCTATVCQHIAYGVHVIHLSQWICIYCI